MRKSKLALKGLVGGAGVVIMLVVLIKTVFATFLFQDDSFFLQKGLSVSKGEPSSFTPSFFTDFWLRGTPMTTDSQPPTPAVQPTFTPPPYTPPKDIEQAINSFANKIGVTNLIRLDDNTYYSADVTTGKFHIFWYDKATGILNYALYDLTFNRDSSNNNIIGVIYNPQGMWSYKWLPEGAGEFAPDPEGDLKGFYKTKLEGGWHFAGKMQINRREIDVSISTKDKQTALGNTLNKFNENVQSELSKTDTPYTYKNNLDIKGYEGKWTYTYQNKTYLVENGRLIRDAQGWIYYYGEVTDGQGKGVVRVKGDIWEIYRDATFGIEIGDGQIGIDPTLGNISAKIKNKEGWDRLRGLELFKAFLKIPDRELSDQELASILLNTKQVAFVDNGKTIKFGTNMDLAEKAKAQAIFNLDDNNGVLKSYKYFTKTGEQITAITFWEEGKDPVTKDFNAIFNNPDLKNILKIAGIKEEDLQKLSLEKINYAFKTNRLIFDAPAAEQTAKFFVNYDPANPNNISYAGLVGKFQDEDKLFISVNQDLKARGIPVKNLEGFDIATFEYDTGENQITTDPQGNRKTYQIKDDGINVELISEPKAHPQADAVMVVLLGAGNFEFVTQEGSNRFIYKDKQGNYYAVDIHGTTAILREISTTNGITERKYTLRQIAATWQATLVEGSEKEITKGDVVTAMTGRGFSLEHIAKKIKIDPINEGKDGYKLRLEGTEKDRTDYIFSINERGELQSYAVKEIKDNKINSVILYTKDGKSFTIGKDILGLEDLAKKLFGDGNKTAEDLLKAIYENGIYNPQNGLIIKEGDTLYLIRLSPDGNSIGESAFKVDKDKKVTVLVKEKDAWKSALAIDNAWFLKILNVKDVRDLKTEDITSLLALADLSSYRINGGEGLFYRLKISSPNSKIDYYLIDNGGNNGVGVDYAFEYVKEGTNPGLYIRNSADEIGLTDPKAQNYRGRISPEELSNMANKSGRSSIEELLKVLRADSGNVFRPKGFKLFVDDFTNTNGIYAGNQYIFFIDKENIALVHAIYSAQGLTVNLYANVREKDSLTLGEELLKKILNIPSNTSLSYDKFFEGIVDKIKADGKNWILPVGEKDIIKFYKLKDTWQAIQIKDTKILIHTDLTRWGNTPTTIEIRGNVLATIKQLTNISDDEELLKVMEYNKDNGRIIVTKGRKEDDNLEVYGFSFDEARRKIEYASKIFKDKSTGEFNMAIYKEGKTLEITLKEIDFDEILEAIGITGISDELERVKALAGSLTAYLEGKFNGKAYNQLVLKNKGNYYVLNLEVKDEESEEGDGEKIKVGRIKNTEKMVISETALNNIKKAILEDINTGKAEKDKKTIADITFKYMFFNIKEGRVEAMVNSGKDKFRYVMWFDTQGNMLGDKDDHLSEAGKLFEQLNQQLEMINADPMEWGDFIKTAVDEEGNFKLENVVYNKNGDKKDLVKVELKDRNGQSETLYIDPESKNILVEISDVTMGGNSFKATNYYSWSPDGLSAEIEGELKLKSGEQKIGTIKGKTTYIAGENGLRKFKELHLDISYTDGSKYIIDYKIEGNKAIRTDKQEEGGVTKITTVETIFDMENGKRVDKERTITKEEKGTQQGKWWNYYKAVRREVKSGDTWKLKEGKANDTEASFIEEFSDGNQTIKIRYDINSDGTSTHRIIEDTKGGKTLTAEETVEGAGDFLKPSGSIKVKVKGQRYDPDGKVINVGRGNNGEEETTVTRTYHTDQNGNVTDYTDVYEKATDEQIKKNAKAVLGDKADEFMNKLAEGEEAAISYIADLIKQAQQAQGQQVSDEQARAAAKQYYDQIVSGGKITYEGRSSKVIKVEQPKEAKPQPSPSPAPGQGPTAQGTASTTPSGAGPSKVSEDTNLPSTGMRSPGEMAKREINKAFSEFRKIAKGDVEEILNYLRERGFVDTLSEVHIGKLSRFKNQRVARGYKLAQTVMKKFKEILKTQGKEKAKAYLKKLGLSDVVIEKVFGSEDNPMSEEEAIKRAQAVLMGATDEEIEKVAKGELSLEDLAKKYKLPDSVVEKIMNLTDATEAWGILLLNVKDEAGNLALENVESIQNILNILEEAKPSEDKYNEISQIMQEVLELSQTEVGELIGTSPAQLSQSLLSKYDQKQAALDYFKQETGFSDFTAQLITTGNAEGLDGLLDRIAEVINDELGGKITQKEWDAKKDKLINGILKALFSGKLTPDADVEGIVKEIIDEVNFKFTTSPQESPAPSDLIDRENLRGRIGIDLINNPQENPQEQAVRKQGQTLGGSSQKKEEERLKELIRKIRAKQP